MTRPPELTAEEHKARARQHIADALAYADIDPEIAHVYALCAIADVQLALAATPNNRIGRPFGARTPAP